MGIDTFRASNSKLIGIAGQMRNGKDTVVNRLMTQLHDNFNEIWINRAWADGLKQVLYDAFGLSKEYAEHWKTQPEPPPGFNMAIRKALQFIGDGFRDIKDDVWIQWTLQQMQGGDGMIISDSRYVNELLAVAQNGGFNVLVIRPDFINNDPHPSESQLAPIVKYFNEKAKDGIATRWLNGSGPPGADQIDFILKNDGTEEALCQKVDELLIPHIRWRCYGEKK